MNSITDSGAWAPFITAGAMLEGSQDKSASFIVIVISASDNSGAGGESPKVLYLSTAITPQLGTQCRRSKNLSVKK